MFMAWEFYLSLICFALLMDSLSLFQFNVGILLISEVLGGYESMGISAGGW